MEKTAKQIREDLAALIQQALTNAQHARDLRDTYSRGDYTESGDHRYGLCHKLAQSYENIATELLEISKQV